MLQSAEAHLVSLHAVTSAIPHLPNSRLWCHPWYLIRTANKCIYFTIWVWLTCRVRRWFFRRVCCVLLPRGQIICGVRGGCGVRGVLFCLQGAGVLFAGCGCFVCGMWGFVINKTTTYLGILLHYCYNVLYLPRTHHCTTSTLYCILYRFATVKMDTICMKIPA